MANATKHKDEIFSHPRLTLPIYQTQYSAQFLLSMARDLTSSEQRVLDLMMSILLVKNISHGAARDKVLASGNLDCQRYNMIVDLRKLARVVYAPDSISRVRDMRLRWTRKFVEICHGFMDRGILFSHLDSSGAVLNFGLNKDTADYIYEAAMPAPLIAPAELYRFPRYCDYTERAFLVNRMLLLDLKMNAKKRKYEREYCFTIPTLCKFSGLIRPEEWTQHKSKSESMSANRNEGLYLWEERHLMPTVGAFGIFSGQLVESGIAYDPHRIKITFTL